MSGKPAYLNEDLSFEERAKDLVSRMTLDEKISQMIFSAPAIPRLGIPQYNWWNEALHGVARAGVATMFPQAIGMAATFDQNLLQRVGDIISTEARAKYHEFIRKGDREVCKGLTFWSPNINIFRDPRWGRGQETYGEDPYLTGRLGVAFIKGLQGDDKKYLKVSSCVKHYAAHSGPEAERHSFNAVVSKKDLRETYLYAFRDCVKEGKVESVMGAYSRLNGEPCCGSKSLLNGTLREEWGFEGHVVSDCWAICDFHEHHMVTKTAPESAALAVNSGCDLNCGVTFGNLLVAIEEGLTDEETIDRAVTRLMITRMKLGMFDDDMKVSHAGIPYEMNTCREHTEYAVETAKRSMVLLKNEGGLLPLDKKRIKSIAVIGPNADSKQILIGNYYGTAPRYITVLEGIHQAVGDDIRLFYAEGCHLYKELVDGLSRRKDRFSEAISAAERSDVVIMCLGIDSSLEGEQGDISNVDAGGDRKDLNLPGLQQELLETIHKVGKPIVLLLFSGSALSVSWTDENIPAIVQAWYPGAEGGRAVASLLFGEFSPAGRLPVTFYRSVEDLPDFKDYSMKGRTYRYMEKEALYPFGYGLSYTKFQYSDLKLSKDKISPNESIKCSATVKNVGGFESEECVQLYLRDVEGSVELPRWQLRGFSKILLKPGEVRRVSFTLNPKDLALIDNCGRCMLEPGFFEIYLGGSQPDERSRRLTGTGVLKGEFEVVGDPVEFEY